MKTKIYIVLLLGLFSIKSNAQEQFLKFDSIQVIQGEHLATYNFQSFSIYDTVTCPVGGYVQVKYVVLDVETISGSISQYVNQVRNYRCKVNGIGIASIKSANKADVYSGLQDSPNSFESVDEIGLMYNSNVYFNIYGSYDPNSSNSVNNMYFRYRIELHHYSYE